ncbi:MAG TPA: hypothetical protein VJ044_13870, partial [Candidatus Hodarchaeales archaeon]|nr:hypothetical protein [Candidatus Hodarchaeales archaeon]
MSELREKLLEAYRADNFLQTALESTFGVEESRDNVTETLVVLHNEGAVDLIEQFTGLCNKPNSGSDFFLTRHLLEKSLPLLNAPIQQVMACVAHLAKEAGQDMMANSIFTSFIDFCVADPSRPDEALRLIKESPNQWMDYVCPTIIAGTRADMGRFFEEAMLLTDHEDIEIRKRAIFSLGRIQYPAQSELPKRALDCLERLVLQETDDQLLGNALKSICSICITDGFLVDKGEKIMDSALSKGGDYALYAVSESFGSDIDKLPELLLDMIIRYLPRLNTKNKGTVDKIDYGVLRLLKRDDPSQGIEFLENLLLTHAQDLSLESLDSVVHGMQSPGQKLLNKLLTRWFLKGDRVLCDGIRIIVDAVHGEEMHLEVDPAEIPTLDFIHLIFLAHKAIGYLFLKPITSASIVISLMRQTNAADAVQELGSFLFDPLLLNFSGALHDYLVSRVANESGQTKDAIQAALDNFKAYLKDLKSVGNIPEMHPSQDQREAQARHFHQTVSKSFKEAMKGSVFNLLCSQSVILYGRKSINYIQGPSGQSKRMEIPMSSHGTQIEVPRQDHIDPYGL